MRSFAFPLGVSWLDAEASVMKLLSADALTAGDFMAGVMTLLPPNIGPASGFEYAEYFPELSTVLDYSFCDFRCAHCFELYMPNVWLRGGL